MPEIREKTRVGCGRTARERFKSSQNRWECKSNFVDILMNNETLVNGVDMLFTRVFYCGIGEVFVAFGG